MVECLLWQDNVGGVVNGGGGARVWDGEEFGELDVISHLSNHHVKGALRGGREGRNIMKLLQQTSRSTQSELRHFLYPLGLGAKSGPSFSGR